jgi:hypothetical protein
MLIDFCVSSKCFHGVADAALALLIRVVHSRLKFSAP